MVGGSTAVASVERVEDDASLWTRLAKEPMRAGYGLVWRACVPPSKLGTLFERSGSLGWGLVWHAGAGDGRLRFSSRSPDRREMERQPGLDATRFSLGLMRDVVRDLGGALVVERAPARVRREFDSWGLSESAAFLSKRVKEQLDPSDTFSPARFSFTETVTT